MACPLTKGLTIPCRDAIGGLKSILVTEFDNITAFNETAGVVDSMTQSGGTSFWRYNLEKENGDFLTTENVSVENGTTFYSTVLNFTIKKMQATTSEELKLLALNRLIILMEDNNGKYWTMGITRAADKVGGTNTAASGKATGDMNGYTLGFTDMESDLPFEVDTATIASLTIG